MIVAFDFDGTLAPSFNLVNRCIIQVAKDNGIFLKESDLIPYYGPTEEGMINNILKSDNRANFKKYLQYIETVEKFKKDVVEYIKNYQDNKLKELLLFKKYYDNENDKNVFKIIYKDKYNVVLQ